MGLTQSANCREALISARPSKRRAVLPRAIAALAPLALAILQSTAYTMSYSVRDPSPRHHDARSVAAVNDANYPGPGGKMHSWKRNLSLALAQTELPKKVGGERGPTMKPEAWNQRLGRPQELGL